MIEIVKKKEKRLRITIRICEDPTLGTWGSHQLLLDEYKSADGGWIATVMGKAVYDQMMFNTAWLESILSKYSELHCEYCGKPHLKIYPWNIKPNLEIVATTDHFLPKKTHPQFAKETGNLVVSCHRCNTNKKAKAFPKSAIKFPYPEVRIF